MQRASVYETTQIGVESVAGTATAANRRLLCLAVVPDPDIPRNPYRPMGSKAVTQVVAGKESTEASLEGPLCYNDLTYVFNSLLTTGTISTPSGATDTRQHLFVPNAFDQDTPKSYTVETGSSAGAERFTYGMVNGGTFRWTEDESTFTGTMIGQELTEGISLTSSPTDIAPLPVNMKSLSLYIGDAQTNEVQQATVGTNSAGQFKLTFTDLDGSTRTTADIAFNAAGAAVQSALEAILGVGNVTVSGSGPYDITFAGRYAGLNVDTLSLVNGTTPLSGGTGQGVSVTTAGGLTRLTKVTEFEIAITDRVTAVKTLDASEPSWSYVVERAPDATFSMVLQQDATGQALVTDLKNGQKKIIQAVCIGPNIEGIFYNRLEISFPGFFTNVDFSDQDDVWSATLEGSIAYDSTFGGWIKAVLHNELTAL